MKGLITTAKDTLTIDNIMLNVVEFYENEVFFAAKEDIFSFCNEHPVKRKVTNELLNPAVLYVKDILTLLIKVKGKVSIPSLVAANYKSFPPSNFEPLAAVLFSLEDELAALIGGQVALLRKFNVDNVSSNADSSCVKDDISDIKLML